MPSSSGLSSQLFKAFWVVVYFVVCTLVHTQLQRSRSFQDNSSSSDSQESDTSVAIDTPPVAPVQRYDPGKPPFPTDASKPVVYLMQLEGTQPKQNMNGADILCITWKQEQHPCDHLPGATWTQGRNFLWKKAVEMKKKYWYYVFMDEDIILNNVTLFEEYLVTWQPPIGVPNDPIAQLYPEVLKREKDREALTLWSFDAAFDAFHYDVMHESLLLPYGDIFDHFSWWISQFYVIYLAQISFLNEVVGFMRVTAANKLHRPYPRRWNATASHIFFCDHIIVDHHLRDSMKGYVWDTPGIAYPKPKEIQRYHMPEEFMTILDSDTIWWKRIAEIRNSKDGRPPMRDFGITITD